MTFKEEKSNPAKKHTQTKGAVYFVRYRDAADHLELYAPTGRIVSYELGWACQVRVSGPYLNIEGEIQR